MFKRPVRETVAAFPAEESQLAGLRKTVEEICLQTNLSSKEINNIILAIEEGATNIIRHAYLLGEGEIRLKVAIFKHSIVFSLFDTGKSFQPPDKTKLDLKRMATTGRKGGLGFYLINKVMDQVEYFSLEGENELRMTKFLSEKAEQELEWSGGVSLRVKFSAWTFLIILILVAGAYWYIDSVTSTYIQSRLEKTVDALSSTITTQAYGYIINQRSPIEFDELVVSYQETNDVIESVIILDAADTILADSRGADYLRTKFDSTLLPQLRTTGHGTGEHAHEHGTYLVRTVGDRENPVGTVIMEYSSAAMQAQIKRARQIILLITAVGLLIGITGIYLLSNYFVRPIGRIVDRVRKFSQGDMDSQLPLVGAGEFYEISRALNELIMRIRRDRKNIVEREILQKEMEMAEEIQRALIPRKLPSVEGFDIATIYRAARLVGGDLFDIVQLEDHSLAVVVADVSGKGVPGSLVMSMVRTALRREARESRSAREIIIRMNDFIADDIKQGMFVTILMAVIDTRTGNINFASAGHNPILHYDSQKQKAHFINSRGMPVGIKAKNVDFAASIEASQITMARNDFLLMYTDGVTEGRGPRQEPYGTARIIELLSEFRDESARVVAREIEKDIIRFIGNADQHDDITMVIVKNCPPPENDAATDNDEAVRTQTYPDTNRPGIDSVTVQNPSSDRR